MNGMEDVTNMFSTFGFNSQYTQGQGQQQAQGHAYISYIPHIQELPVQHAQAQQQAQQQAPQQAPQSTYADSDYDDEDSIDTEMDDVIDMFGNVNMNMNVNVNMNNQEDNVNVLGYKIYSKEDLMVLRQQHSNSCSNFYDILDGVLQGTCFYNFNLIISIQNYLKTYLKYAKHKPLDPYDHYTYSEIKKTIKKTFKNSIKNDNDELEIIRNISSILNLIVLAESTNRNREYDL